MTAEDIRGRKIYKVAEHYEGLSTGEIMDAVCGSLEGLDLKRVLILPPDFTRYHSNAGQITFICYHTLTERGVDVDIMPALGTHVPVTREQWELMFAGIPYEKMIVHDWRNDVEKIGEIPAEYISEITDGLWNEPVMAEVNRRIMDDSYDLIISPGQVVPHEVIGMSNHSKNIFVGAGGSDMINKSHMIGAVYGMERMMGRDNTPVRKIFDYALEHFLSDKPILWMLTVTSAENIDIHTHGLFIGTDRECFKEAVALAQKMNIYFIQEPVSKCVVYLDPMEFKSTWLGNKAVYRTRMALADGAELVILAPALKEFGEDPTIDTLIRKYGYKGTPLTLEATRANKDLQDNLGASAHLIHGSSEGRFKITYCPGPDMTREEIESVGFAWGDLEETLRRYPIDSMTDGWNRMPDGEEVYYISNPALGLWAYPSRFID